MENRIEKVRARIKEKGLDVLLVLIDENRRFLSGFAADDTQFDESSGALFITMDKLILATDSRYLIQAKNEASEFEIYCYKKGLAREIGEIIRQLKIEKPNILLGFESVRLTLENYEKIKQTLESENNDIELISTEGIVESLRVLKNSDEIKAIKKSLAVAESSFSEIIALPGLVGMTEKQVAWELEKLMRDKGAQEMSFPPIIASGPNSALPHAVPTDRVIKKNEPILFDFGARLDGYCSDTTRTFVIGEPDAKFKDVFETVLKANQSATEQIKPGISSKEIDAIARRHIEDAGYGEYFGHGLGHGVGLAVHEQPRISPLSDVPLEPGMVFTVEPGIYLPEWGGVRLENMVLVTMDGVEVLNRLELVSF